jgi:tRNA pseudouridine65 synthase
VLEILHQDAHLVAVSKPSGLLVHRTGAASDRDTCMTLLRNQLRRWVYPVHRLDRGASGVLLFSLDPDTARIVTEAFTHRRVKKTYLAVVRGVVPDEGTIDCPLTETPEKEPAEARTVFTRLAQVELPHAVGRYETARYSLARVEPLTGRMHQIRKHMAHIRHPLVGDVTHGDSKHNRLFRDLFRVPRLLLHAEELCLPLPHAEGELTIRAPLPEELTGLFQSLGFQR